MSNTHHHDTKKFPKDFLWGTATAAHQVEGDNVHSDWWHYEQTGKLPHKSGKACDQYNRYEEDFDLIKQLGHNTHRLSIEWARLEPEEGRWDYEAVDHYRHVFEALQKRDIKIMLTLHHFTLPQWLAEKGGFEKITNLKYFYRFVKFVAEQYAKQIDFWVTINEPGVYIYQGYQTGEWPPKLRNTKKAYRVYLNLAIAHSRAYKIIHQVCRQRQVQARVGIAQNLLSFATYRKHSLLDQTIVWWHSRFVNHGFYLLSGREKHDFLGINYYFRVRFKREQGSFKIIHDDISTQGREVSDMGWEIYPHGLFDVLMDLRDFNRPIYITENGIASANDDRRQRFLVAHLNEIYHAIKGGADVRGYYHWSLLDNYEWHHGFGPRFGLIEVNFRSQERRIKESGRIYSEIIKANGLEHKMFRLLGHEAKL